MASAWLVGAMLTMCAGLDGSLLQGSSSVKLCQACRYYKGSTLVQLLGVYLPLSALPAFSALAELRYGYLAIQLHVDENTLYVAYFLPL
jgi:uncharacterized membrane protein YdcZ (DUF606 family)